MTYKFDILYQVKIDIREGFDWYENKKLGLGIHFVDEIETTFSYIKKYPKHFQIKYKNKYREAVLKKFPYLIIFEIIKDTIVVLSVFPSKQNPTKKPNHS